MTKEELEKVCQDLSDKFGYQVKQVMKLEEKVNGVEFINKQLNEQLIQKSDTNHQLVEQIAKLNERCLELEAENEQIKNSDSLCKLIGEQKIKIAELEETIDKLREQFALRYDLEDKIKELKAQLEQEKNLNQCLSDHNEQLRELIEKMKCCSNCRHSRTEHEHCKTDKHENWEIREK